MGRANLLEQRCRFVIESHEWFLPLAMIDGNRSPMQVFANASRETFRDRFLGGPARGVMLVRIFQTTAVGLFLGGENALHKMIAVLLQDTSDALDIDEVAAEADERTAGGKDEAHVK